MNEGTLQRLIEDADLVADVGVRLGRIKDPRFFDDLNNARRALASDVPSAQILAELQKSLNSAIKDIAPITLGDIKSGWKPFGVNRSRFKNIFFTVLCIILLFATAYWTQLYDRACTIYATGIELQETPAAEQTLRLFGLLKHNTQDVMESLTSGKSDFLYDYFNKAFLDLEKVNTKFRSYRPIAAEVLYDLDIAYKLNAKLQYLAFWLRGQSAANTENPTGSASIDEWKKNYGKSTLAEDQDAAATPSIPEDVSNLDAKSLLSLYVKDVMDFASIIGVDVDPLNPRDDSYYLYQLRNNIGLLGSWVLPGLYGMVGAVVFHMRRLLDASLPDPTWLHLTYRILLGGFAGIIFALFITAPSENLGQPVFATLTTFGLAFLVGFSTDLLFQALDRLITYLSQATGKAELKA